MADTQTVFSLNVPVPGAIERLAADRHPELYGFDAVREAHTLVVKRLGSPGPGEFATVEKRARRAIAGTPPFEARVASIDAFDRPASGTGPVVYLAVESPGLEALHARLADAFEPVPGVEGPAYVPHVTLARGGDPEAVARLRDREFDPVTWTVDALEFYDARHGERTGVVSLPA